MENQQIYTPVQRDIKRFGEALVSFMFDNEFSLDYPTDETKCFIEETCMELVFNETMRRAVKYIYLKEVKNVCPINIHRWHEDAYASIVRQMLKMFHNGEMILHYEAEMILYFCVEVTISAKMFKWNGFMGAHNIAVSEICVVLEVYFATKCRWDAFNTAAKDICENIACHDTITAKSFCPEIAESALQIATFEASSSGTHSHCAEPRMVDKSGGIFSHGSGKESEMQVDDPEHTSGISESKSIQSFLFPNVLVQKRRLETGDEVGSIFLRKKARLDFNWKM